MEVLCTAVGSRTRVCVPLFASFIVLCPPTHVSLAGVSERGRFSHEPGGRFSSGTLLTSISHACFPAVLLCKTLFGGQKVCFSLESREPVWQEETEAGLWVCVCANLLYNQIRI